MLFNFKTPEIDFFALLPMIIVAVTGMIALILDMMRPNKKNDQIVLASLIGLGAAIVVLFMQLTQPARETMTRMVLVDRLAVSSQITLLVGTALVILFSEAYLRQKKVPFGEFYPLLLWSVLGGMIMCATQNLLALFLGIEILSISLYVMAGMSRGETKSEESALKYFLLGSFATGFLLMGIAFLYGATGTLHISSMMASFGSLGSEDRLLYVLGAMLVFIALGFKSSFVPFHQWTPDVYQGAPTNVVAFMATGAKLGGFIALFRFVDLLIPAREVFAPAIAIVAALTMTVGNLAALTQKDVKRTMAYSSIANAGYVLVAVAARLAAPSLIDSSTLTYYLIAYTLTTIGTFSIIALAANAGEEVTSIQQLKGLRLRSPLAAFALTLFVLSLIGIPPTPGFFGKLFIFNDALSTGLGWLAIVLAANSVISIGYYYNLLATAWSSEGETTPKKLSPGFVGTFGLCIAGMVAVVIFYAPLMSVLMENFTGR